MSASELSAFASRQPSSGCPAMVLILNLSPTATGSSETSYTETAQCRLPIRYLMHFAPISRGTAREMATVGTLTLLERACHWCFPLAERQDNGPLNGRLLNNDA